MTKNFIKNVFFISLFIGTISSCKQGSTEKGSTENGVSNTVKDFKELQKALDSAKAGDEIVMANGVWKDVEIRFNSIGTAENPITLRAETPGKVSIEGVSDLKFGGKYLTVDGLHFKNGYTPSNAVIDFKVTEERVANHCRITNCVIEGFNPPQRDTKNHWVEFWGRNNQMDHCYLAGKSNEGPTVRVEIKGIRNIKNHHQIVDNHFGPRPRKGGPKGETLQLGDSFSSMSPSNTMVARNLFEECNGEVEVISSKTNFNEFRNNVFYKSEGSLVTRHGNYAIIDGNYFIGDGESENYGGIRIINTGHSVTNNYFFNLRGKNFRSPLAVMNGIPKSPLNRYNQVTDVTVAYNTWVNCPSPLQFGVGTNISQAEVLPPSEIRSARPIRTILANNIIYNEKGDSRPVVAHDSIDGVSFKTNFIDNSDVSFPALDGLQSAKMKLTKINDYIWLPSLVEKKDTYKGFGFEDFKTDLFGNSRTENDAVGAVGKIVDTDPMILDKSKYGPSWFSNEKAPKEPVTFEVNTVKDLATKIADASAGDIIVIQGGVFNFDKPLIIDKKITVRSKSKDQKVQLIYKGAEGTPAFQMQPKGELSLENIDLQGEGSQYAFASLKNGMSSHYNLNVTDCALSNFAYILKAYKESYAEEITFTGTALDNCANGIELSQETNDKGDYNVEFLTIDHCTFNKIDANVIDYYRGGYDESTIGGNLLVTNSTFTNSGGKESNGILINHRGIVNVNISKNTFQNNPVKLVAVLWGAKNNVQSDNTIKNSGEIIVQENLKLTLVY